MAAGPRLLRGLAGLLMVLALAVGCDQPPAEHKETLYVFGTLVEVTLRGVDEDTARRAVSALEQDFRRMHEDWHAWKPGELSALNRAFAEGRSKTVSPFLLPLIKQAKALEKASDGLFNPAIGRLVKVWGFHDDDLPKGRLPDFQRIEELVAAAPSMADVIIEGDRVSSRNPAVSLDFGGFAKGVALDRAVERLRGMGVENAIINAGGDMNIMGSAGDRPWKVGIRHPEHWGVIASLALKDDENLYTSGNYERFRESEGVRYGHIIDPRDGMPVDHIVSASVIHPSGAVADAAATALSVAGPDGWVRIARRMGVDRVLLVDDAGVAYATPKMADRLTFEPGEPTRLEVADDF